MCINTTIKTNKTNKKTKQKHLHSLLSHGRSTKIKDKLPNQQDLNKSAKLVVVEEQKVQINRVYNVGQAKRSAPETLPVGTWRSRSLWNPRVTLP